jgi:hypothetical protein
MWERTCDRGGAVNRRTLLIVGVAVAIALYCSGSYKSYFHSSAATPLAVVSSATSPDEDECKGDECSGNDAGYTWAETHRITDAHECDFAGVRSPFAGGCRAYLEDQKRSESEHASNTPSDEDNRQDSE